MFIRASIAFSFAISRRRVSLSTLTSNADSHRRAKSVADVPGYLEGEFIVQDPGTRLAVALVDPQPGDTVLDACAAPGGKTIQLAWRGADVTACEVNPKRRARLAANLARVHLADSVKVLDDFPVVAREGASGTDASRPAAGTAPSARFAKVLVDAPCSNTGVLRRRPDARWNWSVEKLAALVKLQAEILDRAADLVAPGGTLVYSTCSNENEENSEQVAAFCSRHPDFAVAETRESLPFESNTDGAFAAKLVRRND